MTGLLILAGGLAFAQQGHIAGPVSGYVFDRAGRTLRPVVGVPGASVIGGPIDLGFPASNVWVAPRLDSAVAVAADGSLHFLRIDSGAAAELSFNGATIAPQSVVFSPSGSAAALFARNRATIITGLPDAPVTAGTIDLAAELARPSRLPSLHTVSSAVSDDGAYLLRASGGKVILYGTGGEHRTLADGVEAAFAPGAHKAAIADPSGAGVVVFDDVAAGSGGKSAGRGGQRHGLTRGYRLLRRWRQAVPGQRGRPECHVLRPGRRRPFRPSVQLHARGTGPDGKRIPVDRAGHRSALAAGCGACRAARGLRSRAQRKLNFFIL